MRTHLNTLFVTTQGAYLARRGLTLIVRSEGKTLAQLPLHTLDGVVCFGRVGCSPDVPGCLRGERRDCLVSEPPRQVLRIGPGARRRQRPASPQAVPRGRRSSSRTRRQPPHRVCEGRQCAERPASHLRDANAADSARRDVLLTQAQKLALFSLRCPTAPTSTKSAALKARPPASTFRRSTHSRQPRRPPTASLSPVAPVNHRSTASTPFCRSSTRSSCTICARRARLPGWTRASAICTPIDPVNRAWRST